MVSEVYRILQYHLGRSMPIVPPVKALSKSSVQCLHGSCSLGWWSRWKRIRDPWGQESRMEWKCFLRSSGIPASPACKRRGSILSSANGLTNHEAHAPLRDIGRGSRRSYCWFRHRKISWWLDDVIWFCTGQALRKTPEPDMQSSTLCHQYKTIVVQKFPVSGRFGGMKYVNHLMFYFPIYWKLVWKLRRARMAFEYNLFRLSLVLSMGTTFCGTKIKCSIPSIFITCGLCMVFSFFFCITKDIPIAQVARMKVSTMSLRYLAIWTIHVMIHGCVHYAVYETQDVHLIASASRYVLSPALCWFYDMDSPHRHPNATNDNYLFFCSLTSSEIFSAS